MLPIASSGTCRDNCLCFAGTRTISTLYNIRTPEYIIFSSCSKHYDLKALYLLLLLFRNCNPLVHKMYFCTAFTFVTYRTIWTVNVLHNIFTFQHGSLSHSKFYLLPVYTTLKKIIEIHFRSIFSFGKFLFSFYFLRNKVLLWFFLYLALIPSVVYSTMPFALSYRHLSTYIQFCIAFKLNKS